MPLSEAAAYVVPVSESGREQLNKLRRWASGRCLDAETGGVYRPRERQRNDGDGGDRPRRRTQRTRPPGGNFSLN